MTKNTDNFDFFPDWSNDSDRSQVIAEIDELFKKTWIVDDKTYNLPEFGWSFRYHYTKKWVGFCEYSNKRISLNTRYMNGKTLPIALLLDTVRHEIAHALAYFHYGRIATGKNGHGDLWKDICINVTKCKPTESKNIDRSTLDFKWTGCCSLCGKTVAWWNKKPSRSFYHPNCPKAVKTYDGTLDFVQHW